MDTLATNETVFDLPSEQEIDPTSILSLLESGITTIRLHTGHMLTKGYAPQLIHISKDGEDDREGKLLPQYQAIYDHNKAHHPLPKELLQELHDRQFEHLL